MSACMSICVCAVCHGIKHSPIASQPIPPAPPPSTLAVFAAYLGIIAGLGLTLLCLALFERALPALPFSIALGIMFYFLTRLVLEPLLVPMATNYVHY